MMDAAPYYGKVTAATDNLCPDALKTLVELE
jgi:hypothetical protein